MMSNNSFRNYLKITDRAFYDSRPVLYDVADKIEEFMLSDMKVMNISMPPRFGKSKLATAASAWILLCDDKKRILRASYSDDLARSFSLQVRDQYLNFYYLLQKKGVDVRVPSITGTRSYWSIGKNSQVNHLGVSIGGAITGFGADIAIIDDTVKNLLQATSAAIDNQLNIFLQSVLIGRLENERKIINVGTRWTTTDWFTKFCPDVEVVLPALDLNGESICESWKSTAQIEDERRVMSADIFAAQYMQRPSATGHIRLFEFTVLQSTTEKIEGKHYLIIDPATNFGKDYFVVGDYIVEKGKIYLSDMYAKQATTISAVAEYIKNKDYALAYCEANGLGRNVIEKLRKKGCKNIVGFVTNKDKYTRAYLQKENIENYLYICSDLKNETKDMLMQQMRDFPISEHDDMLDNVVMAFEKLI